LLEVAFKRFVRNGAVRKLSMHVFSLSTHWDCLGLRACNDGYDKPVCDNLKYTPQKQGPLTASIFNSNCRIIIARPDPISWEKGKRKSSIGNMTIIIFFIGHTRVILFLQHQQ
jgi:hypothetical protein